MAIEQRHLLRYKARLLLGGMPFLGAVEDLRAVDALIDATAQVLEATYAERYPTGTGKARQTLLVCMRAEYEEGITPANVAQWLAKHNKTAL